MQGATRRGRRFAINLHSCKVVNSVGISILIETIDEVTEAEGQLVFCCIPKHHYHIFDIMGLTQDTQTYTTEGEALKALDA